VALAWKVREFLVGTYKNDHSLATSAANLLVDLPKISMIEGNDSVQRALLTQISCHLPRPQRLYSEV
jgi:hypothetical protein